MNVVHIASVKIGTPIAMGTDAAVGHHGRNALEFELMTKAGMKPELALMTGTAHAAELLGVSDITGSLVSGKSADIIAVSGNPLRDMSATSRPLFVMKEGQIYVEPKR
ncbi:MAG: amidohydrolase family protein [Herminiimonas sp.]|nr:amidohydrolase family protein [Herminiimonas sp.]